jgi:hypothetical protein
VRQHIREVLKHLEEVGAHPRLDPCHKHPRIYYQFRGTERFYVVSGSPSDGVRSAQRAIAELKRLMRCAEFGKEKK